MKADYHMHTSFSADCQFDMEELIQTSIEKGLQEICITDHIDYAEKRKSYDFDYQMQLKKIREYQEKYQGQIVIKRGVEFGVQRHTLSRYQRDFNENEFDFVLLSCHGIDDEGFFRGKRQNMSQQEVYELYYREILTCMKNYHDYSVLGHLDVLKRYDPKGAYGDEHVEPLICEVLQFAIKDGKGIEINTSNFRYGLSDLTPSRRILELYHELGGKILTFGSDAHKAEHVGFKIDELKQIAREIGFKEFCTFEKMKPIFHRL